jgi:hypothetical protein
MAGVPVVRTHFNGKEFMHAPRDVRIRLLNFVGTICTRCRVERSGARMQGDMGHVHFPVPGSLTWSQNPTHGRGVKYSPRFQDGPITGPIVNYRGAANNFATFLN